MQNREGNSRVSALWALFKISLDGILHFPHWDLESCRINSHYEALYFHTFPSRLNCI